MVKHSTIGDKDPKDPSVTSVAWDEMIGSWRMIDTLLGGTKEMRQAESVYLPPHTEESQGNYEERLSTNVLFNAFEITLDHFVGRPFSDPVRLNSDVPDEIVEHVKDVDLQGNDLTTFCREWFREGAAKGFAHILIDMPTLFEEEKMGRTREDDIREGRKPFWVLIRPENMIFAESEIIIDPQTNEPREVFHHVRLREDIIERVGFAEVVKERIRVIEPGQFAIYEKRKVKRKVEWVVVEAGETGIDFVPIITYYTNRKSFVTAKPPLEDMAYLNIRHWQSMSDQINILTVVRFPMLAVAGATESGGEVMRIGPRQLLSTRDANGRFYYVEHTGASIEAGWKELEKLEQDMMEYGATFLKKQPGAETATGRALDSAEAITPLQDMTLRFIDSVNNALRLHAFWLNKEEGGTVTITSDFGPEEVTGEDLGLLTLLRKDRDISRKAIVKEAMRRGSLSEDYDLEADFKQLQLEDVGLKPLQPQVPGTFDPSEEDGGSPNSTGGKKDDKKTRPKIEKDK